MTATSGNAVRVKINTYLILNLTPIVSGNNKKNKAKEVSGRNILM